MVKPINVGMIGISEGNGHPYSFSCIINGYDDDGLKSSGWGVIYSYISKREKSEFGFPGVKVTHVWTQDKNQSIKIAKAANIPHIAESYEEMIGKVDALIIGRDDYETHLPLAKRFLESGCFVFIDKPLSVDIGELKWFLPYLQAGKLMSCSGLKYAREIDDLKNSVLSLGEIKLVRGAVVNHFEKYGVHLLDAIFSCIYFNVKTVTAVPAKHDSAILYNEDGSIIQIDALGPVTKVFQLDFFGTSGRYHAELQDNFTAFRRTLGCFFEMIKTGKPPIEPDLTLGIMKTIIAFNISRQENRTVHLKEIYV